jgi:hypothetical protein
VPAREPTSAELDRWAEALADEAAASVARRNHEPGLISDLDPFIRRALTDLYGFDESAFDVERDTLPRGEGYSPVDRVYGSVLAEYEWRMDRGRRRHGSQQALNYLSNIERTTSNPGAYSAIVLDGLQWGFLIDRPEIQPSLFGPVDRADDEYFEWRENSPAACRRFLQLCGSFNRIPVSGLALARGFSQASPAVREFTSLLAAVLEGRSANDRTDTLLNEWSRSVEVAYGVIDEVSEGLVEQLRTEFTIPSALCDEFAELLFVVHTYFAVVARLVAVEVLAIGWHELESQPSHWGSLTDTELAQRLRRLDAGEIPAGLATIQNLFETDVFSWWVDHLDGELLRAVRGILEILGGFAFPPVAFGAVPATDLLRELYIRLVPRELRKQLGEYPTPTWLAEASLERLASKGAPVRDGRILDPCCGTGAFLMPVLRERITRLRLGSGGSATSDDVQTMLDGIAGMDINPIAVTATRANMLVALGSLAEVGGFSLPVWRTDSIVVPDVTPAQQDLHEPRLAGKDHLELRTSVSTPFPIPSLLADGRGISAVRRALELSIAEADASRGRSLFVSLLADEFSPSGHHPATMDQAVWDDAQTVSEVLYERVRALADDGRNGVWARIIENSFAPMFIGDFDVVVGNPPWLGWPKLPARWRADAERLWRRYGLWQVPLSPGERHRPRAQFNDIATLVFATALARYARDDGWVGFLTPEALVIADPGARAFRQFRLRTDASEAHDSPIDISFAMVQCDNWGAIKPFGAQAANRPVFLIAQRSQVHTFPVPTTRWERNVPGTSLVGDWPKIRTQLSAIDGESVPADPAVSFAAWSFKVPGRELLAGGGNSWAFGMGVNTRGAAGIFHVRLDRPNVPAGTVRIRNIPAEGRNRSVVEHVAVVEAALVHPFFRGRDIRPWVVQPSGYLVITQDPTNLERLLPEAEFRLRYPSALAWLRRHRSNLESRTVPNGSWDIQGRDWYRLEGPWAHLKGDFLVVLPEQALPPPAAVVRIGDMNHTLGRRTLPLPNHKVVFCAVPTLDEAGYLVAVLNSTAVQTFLESYGSSTAISPTTLSRLAIPAFTGVGLQADIVALARSILDSDQPEAKAAQVREQLDLAVNELLDAPTPTAPSRRRPRRPRQAVEAPGSARPLFE